jgi:hypothetical protein
MNKLIVLLSIAMASVTWADAVAEPADPGSAERAAAEPAEPAEPARTGAPDAAALRKTCADAMNADPEFAKSIALTIDKQLDQKTLAAHQDAAHHVEKNQRHVIYAYALMWLLAALFVVYLWRRQQGLVGEIAQLKKELDAAAKGGA